MRDELLLDTGALVSLLDRSQTHHLKCRRAFADWAGPVVSTEAVLTEATHLLARVRGGRAGCVDFFLSGGRASRSFEHDVIAACPEAARQVCRSADGLC
jgi:predicted nucleic acid-binding protein